MKKILVIILVAAMILNIAAGAFLFLDIQQMELPEMTLSLEILIITSEEALLQTTLSISVLVVAELINQDIYRLLSLEGKAVEISLPKGAMGSSTDAGPMSSSSMQVST